MSVTIAGYVFDFNEDEEEVLLEVAMGLEEGREVYGPMNIMDPEKDWLKEGDEEDRDWLVYRAAHILRERIRRKKNGH